MVDECGRYFAGLAENLGFKVETYKIEKAGDIVCITMNPDSDKAPVCFSGHIDTVHPVGLFGSPAAKVCREENKIYGPGVLDCKGGVVASLYAMHALKEIGFTSRPVMLLLQTDEEVGSSLSGKATINYICERAKNAVAFLNTEGYNKGYCVIERKGILRLKLDVKGVSCHSAKCFNGANAIAEAAYKIIELEKLKDKDGITCNCGVISGGTVANTVPEECSFVADIRYPDEGSYETVMSMVKEIAEKSYVNGCSCKVSLISHRPSMERSEKNFTLLDRINEIFAQNGVDLIKANKSHGGSDAAYTTLAGIPTIDSIGARGDRIHSAEEFAYIDSLAECAKRLAAITYYIK